MKKLEQIIKQIKENKWIHYAIILIIGILLSVQLKEVEINSTHDGTLHLLRTIGTAETIQNGQAPPIINETYCNGYGYAMNLFYPPIVTYIPLIIKLVTPTYTMAMQLFGALCIILSGVTMYQLVLEMTKKRGIALFSAIIYMIAPYKVGDVYRRYAIGEFTAFIFIPMVFMGLQNLINGDKKKHYFIAIGAVGLLLTHTVTTLYTAIFSIIYLMFFIKKLKDKEIIKKILVNIIFILLLSMLFWFPMLEAKASTNYAIFDDGTMSTNSTYVAKNTLELSQFVKDKGEEFGTTFIIGTPIIILSLVSLFVIKKVSKEHKDNYIIFMMFAIVSLIMCTKLFPWQIMPGILAKLQYPWRMEGFFIFFISLIAGINLYLLLQKLFKGNISKILVVLTFVVVAVLETNHIMKPFYAEEKGTSERYENSILKVIEENMPLSHWNINRDYLPLKAIRKQNTYMEEREKRTYILQGNAEIIKEEKNKLTSILEVKMIEKDTILEFQYLYYPGYQITINEEKEIKAEESENGYLSAVIPENMENVTIKIEYVGTIITYVSYGISAIALIFFIGYIIVEKRKK